MENVNSIKMPQFFYDSGSDERDGKCETLIDYWLSWTLRSSEQKYQRISPEVNIYARQILLFLFFGKNDENEKFVCNLDQFRNIEIVAVETWKQDSYIDLWSHVTLSNGKKYALIIENKYYGLLREGQLEKYRDKVEKYYKERDENYEIQYVFFTCHDPVFLEDKIKCKKSGFQFLSFEEVQNILNSGQTGNNLFDEFWFNW